MVEKESPRVEIDTSAPFDSVKEAASRFGEVGYWRRCSFQNPEEAAVTEQATILNKVLISKENQTLDILNKLESTKFLIEELKSKLLSEQSLKQAKESDLKGVRLSVERLNEILGTEKENLKRANDCIRLHSSMIRPLDEDLLATKLGNHHGDASEELQRLAREINKFTETGKSAKLEALKALSEIEQTKSRMKTIEARTTAEKKVQEAPRTVESSAVLKLKALPKDYIQEVSLTVKEYTDLKDISHAAEECAAAEMTEALNVIDVAVSSKAEIVKKVEEATEEVKKSKRVLEEALKRVDTANIEKMHVEETLRKRKSDSGSRRYQVENCYPVKNPGRELKTESTVSIGEILQRKLSVREGNGKDRENGNYNRNKFEFGRFTGILVKKSKKWYNPDLR